MFDINLLKDPGLLDYNENNSSIKDTKDYSSSFSKGSSIDNQLPKVHIRDAKSYLLILVSIGLLILILGSILNHNKVDQLINNNNLKFKDISINSLLTVLQEDNLYTYMNYMNFSNENFSFEADISSENIFYKFLDILGDDFSEEIRGIHKKNKFSIIGIFPWSIKDNNFSLNFLNKEISDFDLDIKKEIYNDKLIIICGIQGAFELLNLITDLNLIDQFQIEIKEIQSLPEQMDLFQIIIH